MRSDFFRRVQLYYTMAYNYRYIFSFIISLIILCTSCTPKYTIESYKAEGLRIKGTTYASMISDKDGSLYLFTYRDCDENDLLVNSMIIFKSSNDGRNWEKVFEMEDIYLIDDQPCVAIDENVYMKVRKYSDRTPEANWKKVSYVLSYNKKSNELKLSDSIPGLDADLKVYKGKLVCGAESGYLFLSKSLKIENTIANPQQGGYMILVSDEEIWAYRYPNTMYSCFSGIEYKLPFSIDDAVLVNDSSALISYREQNKEYANLALLNLKNGSIIDDFRIDDFEFLEGMIKNEDSLIVACTTEYIGAFKKMAVNKDNGKTWEILDIDGMVLGPYCLRDDTLFVMSREYFSSNPKIHKVALR